MIIGVSGMIGAGKDTFASYLEKKGFVHYSLSDVLREELKKRGMPINRKNLQDVGNGLRKEYGDGILAERIIEKIFQNEAKKAIEELKSNGKKHVTRVTRNYVITSIRHPTEVKRFQQLKDFFFVFIDAPIKIRFERIRQRDSVQNFEEFKNQEERELRGEKHKQQLLACKKLAKIKIINDSTLENFYKKIEKLLRDLSFKILEEERPDKITYYLNIAKQISERSTCGSVKIGAIIVKDDVIVASGYVGAPRKVLSCFERKSCLRRELGIPSGKNYELCRSVHAEQNAIINAARSGTSILGGDMYIYGRRVYQGREEAIEAIPCFICKKMIINAGLKRVIISTKEGKPRIFLVKKWREEWQKKDMLDDILKYEVDYYFKSK